MRKLILLTQISLDGFVADKNEKTDRFIWNWGEEWTWDDRLKKYFENLTDSTDTILLSRKMAVEGFVHHWERIAAKNNDQSNFARKILENKKVVFSKTLKKSEWDNTTITDGDFVQVINAMKKEDGKGLVVYGGASFVSSLIKAGLIDEYYLFVNPVVMGKGMPIFREIESEVNLKLVEAKGFESGMVVLNYA